MIKAARKYNRIGLLATLILTSACSAEYTASEKKAAETDKDGFVSIFDGKTLKGWEALPAETAPAWTVKDGMIVGDGDKGVELGFGLEEDRTLLGEVFLGQTWGLPATPRESGLNIVLECEEAAESVSEEDQAHYGQEVLVAGIVGVRPKRVRRVPEALFNCFDMFRLCHTLFSYHTKALDRETIRLVLTSLCHVVVLQSLECTTRWASNVPPL